MAQMRVDYDRLGELVSNLDVAVRVVGNEWESTQTLGSAVGHSGLSNQTALFRDTWDKRRLDLVAQLEWLRNSIQNIQTQLADVDASLATGLTQPPASGAGSAGTTPQAV